MHFACVSPPKKKTWSSNAFPFASLQSASRQAQRHWCFLRTCCLLTTVDGRDLKKPLGRVLEPVVNNGISTTNLPQLGRAYRISNEPTTNRIINTKPQILRNIRGFPWNLSTKLETCVVEPDGSWSCFFSFELIPKSLKLRNKRVPTPSCKLKVFASNTSCIMKSKTFPSTKSTSMYMYLMVNFIWILKVFRDSVSCSCKKHPPECTQRGLKAFEPPGQTRNLSHPFKLLGQ